MEQLFIEYLDGIYYEGYATELLSDYPEAYFEQLTDFSLTHNSKVYAAKLK